MQRPMAWQSVSNAFRLLGSGERGKRETKVVTNRDLSQMPFGFWVLGNTQYKPECTEEELRSQMPFGFWVLGNTEKRNGNVRLVF